MNNFEKRYPKICKKEAKARGCTIYLLFGLLFITIGSGFTSAEKGHLGRMKNILIEEGLGDIKEKKYEKVVFFPKERFPTLIGGTKRQNEVLRYAWEISKSEDFIYTIMGENLMLNHDRKHNLPYFLCWNWASWNRKIAPNQAENAWKCKKGMNGWFIRKHWDWGHGVGDGYHKKIVDDPRFFSDWKWNLEQTFELWNNGTKFYGEINAFRMKKMVKWSN